MNIINEGEHLCNHMQFLFYLSAQHKPELHKITSVQIKNRRGESACEARCLFNRGKGVKIEKKE